MTDDDQRRLLNWASAVVDDIQDRLKGLPEELRFAGVSSLALAMMGEMIWHSADPSLAVSRFKEMADMALEMLPEVEGQLDAMHREAGHG